MLLAAMLVVQVIVATFRSDRVQATEEMVRDMDIEVNMRSAVVAFKE
jgi:hypothetical protein